MPLSSLSGCRVLELGGYLAAPFAGNLLANLGADVIKIEPFSGDPTRFLVGGGPGGTFVAYSHGKRSICIDLTSERGHEVFRRLLATAVVVVHNLAPNSVRKLRVGAEECRSINAGLVYCHIKGFGRGPRQDEVASNPIVEAATGVMFGNRVDGRPTRLGPSYLDMFAGMNAVIGILSELLARHEGKRPQSLELGLYETALHVAARDLFEARTGCATGNGLPAQREFGIPGYGAYETADGRWIYLLLLSDAHWVRFCEQLALPEGADPELATVRGRRTQAARVETAIAAAVSGRDFARLAPVLQSVGIGFTEVRRPNEVFDDPQAQVPGKLIASHYLGRRYEVAAFPDMAPGSGESVLRSDPPRLGQHTVEILQSVGYSAADCHRLVELGAVKAEAADS
ncbi:MAG: CaiB/BaiF CoA transferase family protein [Lautropia sp.]